MVDLMQGEFEIGTTVKHTRNSKSSTFLGRGMKKHSSQIVIKNTRRNIATPSQGSVSKICGYD